MVVLEYQSNALAYLSGLAGVITDWRRPMNSIRAYMVRQIKDQIDAAGGAMGGTARGVHWSPRKAQYTRRDGTPVAAWGGVAKARGKGQVQGLKKQSGERITASTHFYGKFKAGSLLRTRHLSNDSIEIAPSDGPARHLEALRQYVFYTDKDRQRIDVLATKWLGAQVRAQERKAT